MNKSDAQKENDDEFIKDFEQKVDQYINYSDIAKKAWEFMEKGHQYYDKGDRLSALPNYQKALEIYKTAIVYDRKLGKTDVQLARKWIRYCKEEIRALKATK